MRVPARGVGGLCRGFVDSDKLVEGRREPFPKRRHAQHRVKVGQVVVHPRPVDADDPGEAPVHRAQPMARHAEGETEIAEVVIVTGLRNRIEQRRDRLREVLVDVRVRPHHIGRTLRVAASAGRRRDRTGLQNPGHAVLVNRPLDVLRCPQLGLEPEREP